MTTEAIEAKLKKLSTEVEAHKTRLAVAKNDSNRLQAEKQKVLDTLMREFNITPDERHALQIQYQTDLEMCERELDTTIAALRNYYGTL